MEINLKTKDLFDLTHSLAAPILESCEYPWEALGKISAFILEVGSTLSEAEYDRVGADVWISKSARIYPNNFISGPTIIGHNTEVRPGAFIRGNALIGENCVVGNSTELKNTIMFDNSQAPHYNYIGDSIMGYRSHAGAGAITSNLKQDKSSVTILHADGKIDTGLKKFGAMIGDYVEIGCNTVMNPGTIIGRGSRVYPLSMVRGFVPANSIYKGADNISEINS